MIEADIPGFGHLCASHLVLDYNGTLACDGKLITGVTDRLKELAEVIEIHVLTADTFGSAARELSQVPCNVSVISREDQVGAKVRHIKELGSARTVAIGNGRNDWLMLKEAALGIAVMQAEGAAIEAILAADVVSNSILDALDLLNHPLRLTATLRA